MEIESKNSTWGVLKVTYKYPEYGEHSLKLEGHGSPLIISGEFFYINPKYQQLGGHDYYMAIKGKLDLEVGKTYTLRRDDADLSAHLEIDHINGDKSADGTFRLTEGGLYPKGDFQLFEEVEGGVLSAEGEFEFQEVQGQSYHR
ncbi:hypothetical protein [Pseudomonas mandelii]|uniref:hypothetical protein n=1 Tax=Pseudomonas mandelii TaxID=75612 RepID=UPI00209EB728|nr:hypothetical protein [Pseudomonas mandelii]MCO8310228.1 hypothetical protein [Pseudomonas mandelii]